MQTEHPQLGLYRPPSLMRELVDAAQSDPLIAADASMIAVVEAVLTMPYGRPSDRTVEAMLRERRGTCSTKHLFLARVLRERFAETEPVIMHRVYRVDRTRARALFGVAAAAVVPETGLVDVHRYITVILNGHRVAIDVTFPGDIWDGASALPLACGEGRDYVSRDDPDADKRALEREHCDAAVREAFISAVSKR